MGDVFSLVDDSSDDLDEEKALQVLQAALAAAPSGKRARIIEKFLLAALGSIPWVGGFISALATLSSDEAKARTSSMQTKWLEEHGEKIKLLQRTLAEVIMRFDRLGDHIDDRIASPEYLDLVRKSFRAWDQADTEEKRTAVRNLILNAAGSRVCSDDVVRLFIDWLTAYHEAHLAVVRLIYKSPGITRYEIWSEIYGEFPREDSAEADLYRLLIRDLSTGGVIRQARETDMDGRFLKRRQGRPRGTSSRTMESSFEDTKPYVLTELGGQFVHYAMTESTRQIAESSGE